jgi:2,3,4,5-tetrahydropyridine-2-carboxylate N-succinyltransferase
VSLDELRDAILACAGIEHPAREEVLQLVQRLLVALERGDARAAEPVNGGWQVNRWVKQGILLAFRYDENRSGSLAPFFHFRDRGSLLPTWNPADGRRNVRIVPGGSTVRRGAFLGEGVVVMPPAYVNIGAWVDARTMVDSHALVGSCAQIGRNVHLSAAAQIGGVLEPVGARPVIVEDDVFVGGGAGVYEGTRVGMGAVLAPGVILTNAVPVFDLVRGETLRATADEPLAIPSGAVVVPGARAAAGNYARTHGLHVQTPLIVKYRDDSTDAALALEEALR